MKTRKILKSLIAATAFLPLVLTAETSLAQAYDFVYPDTVRATAGGQVNHGFTFLMYQNCTPAPPTFQNIPVSYNFNNGTPVNETMTGFPVLGMGAPFCPSVTATCTPGSPLNYQKSGGTYMFTIPANTTAPGFNSLNTRFGSGNLGSFETRNIAGPFSLDPQIFNGLVPGMTNLAPRFVNPPVVFVHTWGPVSYWAGAVDPDGDSLVYQLRPAAPNVTYVSGLSATNPIWSSASFQLHPATGVMTFMPIAFTQTGGPGAVDNKYVVGINVDEYRKINGVATKIGTIQRNVLINVINSSNNNPSFNLITLDTARFAPNTVKDVVAGIPVTLNFTTDDLDAADVHTITSNISALFPGATLTTTGQNPVSGQITWTPTSANIREQPYYFHVTANDNACPYPGEVTHVFGIRVKNVTGLTSELYKPNYFTAFPNPAGQEVNFKIEGTNAYEEIQVFNLMGKQVDRIRLEKGNLNGTVIRWENASRFSAGTYVARLINSGKPMQTIKFVKLQ